MSDTFYTRLVSYGALIAALVLCAVVAGPALAAPAKWDPQTTNVPYVAWRGEQVRLVKCDPVLATEGVKVEFFVEEWSGTGLVPRVEDATVDNSSGCARADVVSLDPGLARVKLVATNASDRSSAHFTGRPRRLEMAAATYSSA